MRTADIAKRYLDYFAKHDHLIVPSASLISPNPTTLFTIAGMVPFIPYLMGEQTPPKRRMASNQKCVRTLDIDEVGKTTRHGTFFQMLGNFSFGDYFKEEAIHYAWELLTTSQDEGGYGFDPEKLWMTTFTDDDEARSMWINEGVDPEHIQKMGMEDNFWTTGGPEPGGSCSEIYVDRGPAFARKAARLPTRTATSRSGTSCSRTTRSTTSSPRPTCTSWASLRTRTSIPVPAWNVWPTCCRARTTSTRPMRSSRSSRPLSSSPA